MAGDSPLIETDLDDRRSVATTVVEAVAAVSDRPPAELPPLFDSVDTDALDDVFRRADSGHLVFPYAGYTVTVFADDRVTVRESD